MNVVLSVALFIAGFALLIYFAEKLVKGVVGTSTGFGGSAFIISVEFICLPRRTLPWKRSAPSTV